MVCFTIYVCVWVRLYLIIWSCVTCLFICLCVCFIMHVFMLCYLVWLFVCVAPCLWFRLFVCFISCLFVWLCGGLMVCNIQSQCISSNIQIPKQKKNNNKQWTVIPKLIVTTLKCQQPMYILLFARLSVCYVSLFVRLLG